MTCRTGIRFVRDRIFLRAHLPTTLSPAREWQTLYACTYVRISRRMFRASADWSRDRASFKITSSMFAYRVNTPLLRLSLTVHLDFIISYILCESVSNERGKSRTLLTRRSLDRNQRADSCVADIRKRFEFRQNLPVYVTATLRRRAAPKSKENVLDVCLSRETRNLRF